MVRACGSYPQCRGFNSLPRYHVNFKALQFLQSLFSFHNRPNQHIIIILKFLSFFTCQANKECINTFLVGREVQHHKRGEVAQMVRACGSYPQCRGFNSLPRYHENHKALQILQGLFFCPHSSCLLLIDTRYFQELSFLLFI